MKIYEKNQKSLPYQVIFKKNKNAYFRVKPDGLYVTAPKKSADAVLKVIDDRFDVFYEAYKRTLERLKPKNEIYLSGVKYDIVLIVQSTFHYEVKDNTINIYGNRDKLNLYIKKIYLDHVTSMTASILDEVNETLKKHGLKPRPIKFKYLKSKFGSYHRFNDEVTLNTFLATLDSNYLKYVLYHEYAHVVHFNHSKAFYDFLEKLMPDYKVYHKSLKKIAII